MNGKEDLVNALSESIKFFDDVVVREQIYKLQLKKQQLVGEIEKLET